MEHVRIDEGVKRGSRKPATPNPRDRQTGQMLPLATPEQVAKAVKDYAAGRGTLAQIGRQYGVSKAAVYQWLVAHHDDPDTDQVVTQALAARIAYADDALDTGPSPLDVTRAREQARFARMDLERLRPRIYGQKQEVTLVDQRDLGDKLRRANERVIEGESTPVPELQLTADCNTKA